MDDYSRFIALSRYARYLPEKKRRETWEETVDRYINFWCERIPDTYCMWDPPRREGSTTINLYEVKQAIINLEVMPSMRALMTAGPALERDHIAGYNCAYLPIDSLRAFDELFYILMCGTGNGFSVESKYVNQLPEIPDELQESDTLIVFRDSKGGWCRGFRQYLSLLYSGEVARWNLDRIRPEGERLRTFGGRASGPEPLRRLLEYTRRLFEQAKGRKLKPIECHDLCCNIADSVIVGGVRRSALISLGDFHDTEHANAKTGAWYDEHPYRALANNSAVFDGKPNLSDFMNEWRTLYESRSGERGIFNRRSAITSRNRLGESPSVGYDYGTNPCGEIILRPYQFCNLTEVVARPTDTFETLERKVRIATFLGTLQSTLTDFRHLRKIWKKNCEEERLLGVSITGIMDHPILSQEIGYEDHLKEFFGSSAWQPYTGDILASLKQVAIEENEKWSEILGINKSASITCVKPSGTVSQLTNSASGIHPRFSKYYIRRVRMSTGDPLTSFMAEQGIPNELDKTIANHTVFLFPQKAPSGSVMRNDMTALEQLEHWLIWKKNYCEHNPSCTIYVREREWLEVAAWVYEYFDSICGLSFLPHSDHIYDQAPYEEITEEEYSNMLENFPKVKWEEFTEEEDNVESYKELACSAGACEI